MGCSRSPPAPRPGPAATRRSWPPGPPPPAGAAPGSPRTPHSRLDQRPPGGTVRPSRSPRPTGDASFRASTTPDTKARRRADPTSPHGTTPLGGVRSPEAPCWDAHRMTVLTGRANASVPGRGTRQRTVEATGNAGSGLLLHPDPGRRPRPQTGPATGQDLPHADGRTRRRAPPGAVRRRSSAGRTRRGGAQPADARRRPRHRRCPGHPGPGETDHHRQRPRCRSRSAADRRSTKTRPRNRSAHHAFQVGGRPSASRAQRGMTSHTHPDGRTPRGNQPNPLDRQHPITARRTRVTRLAHHRKHPG